MKGKIVPRVWVMVGIVYRFMRESIISRPSTVSIDVMGFLEDCIFISVDKTKPQSLDSVQCYVY